MPREWQINPLKLAAIQLEFEPETRILASYVLLSTEPHWWKQSYKEALYLFQNCFVLFLWSCCNQWLLPSVHVFLNLMLQLSLQHLVLCLQILNFKLTLLCSHFQLHSELSNLSVLSEGWLLLWPGKIMVVISLALLHAIHHSTIALEIIG